MLLTAEIDLSKTQRFLPAELKAGRKLYRREIVVNLVTSLSGGNGFKLIERANVLGQATRRVLRAITGKEEVDVVGKIWQARGVNSLS